MFALVTIYDESDTPYEITVYCHTARRDPSVGFNGGVIGYTVEDTDGFPGGVDAVYDYLDSHYHLLNEACDAA